jgi:ankyrin repeat protein
MEKRLSDQVKDHLAEKLLSIPHRTYLWVYLVFDYLKKEQFKKTLKGIDQTIATMPTSIYAAYEQILTKSHQQEPIVRRALSMILAATRPLTVSEMNIALNVDKSSETIHDLDIEEDTDFGSRLRNLCGLFVSIYNNRVYFIHQTAREFLLVQTSALPTSFQNLCWQHSVIYHDAHSVLAEACVLYLDLLNNGSGPVAASRDDNEFQRKHTFLDYSAKNWGSHYWKASNTTCCDLLSSVLSICSPNSRSWSAWFPRHWISTEYWGTKNLTSLMISSYFGHEMVTRFLVERGANLETTDTEYGQTPLSWAARNGHDKVVRLLLGANLETTDTKYGQTPLSWAARNWHDKVVRLLLGANLETTDTRFGRTPLLWAAEKGHDMVVKLLVERGANLETTDTEYGRTPLLWAARNGHAMVVKLLLEGGANLEITDTEYGQTPLLWAAEKGHDAVVKVLLEQGPNLEITDTRYGQTPLSWAAEKGHDMVVKLLLKSGTNLETPDTRFGRTPLSWAARNGHVAVVKLLLKSGANFEITDTRFGQTPLSWAAEMGHDVVVKLLLESGASFNTTDTRFGQTPLLWAVDDGHDAVVKLLENGG